MSLTALLMAGLGSAPAVTTAPVGGNISLSGLSPATVGIRFNTDGTIDTQEGIGYSYERDWIAPTAGLTASEWEVEVAQVTGDGDIDLSNEDSGYFTISTTRTFQDLSVTGFKSGTWTVTVREIANTSNSASYTLSISVEE